jgi:hypothetical protein
MNSRAARPTSEGLVGEMTRRATGGREEFAWIDRRSAALYGELVLILPIGGLNGQVISSSKLSLVSGTHQQGI